MPTFSDSLLTLIAVFALIVAFIYVPLLRILYRAVFVDPVRRFPAGPRSARIRRAALNFVGNTMLLVVLNLFGKYVFPGSTQRPASPVALLSTFAINWVQVIVLAVVGLLIVRLTALAWQRVRSARGVMPTRIPADAP